MGRAPTWAAGFLAFNKVKTDVEALIKGTGTEMVRSTGRIAVTATDGSQIEANSVDVAVTVSAANSTAISGSIGASMAHNTIDNKTRAIIDRRRRC